MTATSLSYATHNSTFSICDFQPSTFSAALASYLGIIEQEDTTDTRANFVTALNAVLVWSGARTATLPSWDYCDPSCVIEFVINLNRLCQHLPASVGTFEELIILPRLQIYRTGLVVNQEIIARRNCPGVRMTKYPPIRDDEVGRELDMYPPNVDYFVSTFDIAENAFSVWEAGADVLLFAEVFSPENLSPPQLQYFLQHCEETISRWNSAMERMGLVYRVYGTMDWCRSDVPFEQAEKTMQYFGKAFIGTDRRVNEYSAHVLNKNKL